jgi:hypothetical protein
MGWRPSAEVDFRHVQFLANRADTTSLVNECKRLLTIVEDQRIIPIEA